MKIDRRPRKMHEKRQKVRHDFFVRVLSRSRGL